MTPPPIESAALLDEQVLINWESDDRETSSLFGQKRQRRADNDDNAKVVGRERIAERYEHLVRLVVGKISSKLPPHVDKEDLVSEGMIGLMDALEKFDRDKGIKFETYAVNRIRGAILDYLRKIDWVPRSTRRKSKELEKVYAELEKNLQRVPTDEEAAATLGISIEELRDLLIETTLMTPSSLEEIWGDENDGLNTMYFLHDEKIENPSESIVKKEMKKLLLDACHKLPGKECAIVSLLYGENLTFREISSMLKISISRVSQLHARALIRLRAALGAFHEEFCFE